MLWTDWFPCISPPLAPGGLPTHQADRTGDNLVLRQAIFRNIFFEEGLSGGVEDPQVHRMAAYVTLQAQHMQDNSPCELLLEGTLSWLPLQSSLPQQQQQKKKT